jgi:hypothetical protein
MHQLNYHENKREENEKSLVLTDRYQNFESKGVGFTPFEFTVLKLFELEVAVIEKKIKRNP